MKKFIESDAYKTTLSTNSNKAFELIDEAILLYRQLDNTEGELRALMIKADIYEFIGNTQQAQMIAGEVLPKAQALQYVRQIESAQDHLAGHGLKAKLNSSIKNLSQREKCEQNANWSDDHIKFLAAQMIRICDLPEDRYAAMEYEYNSIKEISQEKLKWCEHLELLQDLNHRQSPATMFKYNPDRICSCELYGWQGLMKNPDFEVVLKDFKEKICLKCPSRKPLNTT